MPLERSNTGLRETEFRDYRANHCTSSRGSVCPIECGKDTLGWYYPNCNFHQIVRGQYEPKSYDPSLTRYTKIKVASRAMLFAILKHVPSLV